MTYTRRDLGRFFAASAGCFVVSASPIALSGCTSTSSSRSRFKFPQGVASADPQSDAIVLWSRVEGNEGPVPLTAQLSLDRAFSEILAEQKVFAEADLDHTVRILITDLSPDRTYFYRFIAPDGGASRIGRTRTAPALDAQRSLKIAVFSCQDYEQGYFTSYRRMILDDNAAAPNDRIDFVMHVGDFIYETIRGSETKGESDLNGNPVRLSEADGSPRLCGPLPSGGRSGSRNWVLPKTLDDYRALYKKYLTDPDLQEARANYPFVQTWDDHELLNDYWQSYYKNESVAELKVAANKAWYEFVPAALHMGGRDVDNHSAKDFKNVDVRNVPAANFDDDYFSTEPNNVAAIGSMTIYRSLRWGGTAELFMIDGRSYRGPRGLPQELLTIGRHPYPSRPIAPGLIDILNDGREANDGYPPKEITFLGKTLPNPRKTSPKTSMLGASQKAWLKNGLAKCDARWKLLGLNVGLMSHGFDESFREDGGVNHILWTDGWDGYPSERRELTQFIDQEAISNVVSLTGDRHAHMAGVVFNDFSSDKPKSVMPEFAGGAVSAPNRLVIQKTLLAHDHELKALVSFDGMKFGDAQRIMPALNAWMLFGAESAKQLSETGSDAKIERLANDKVNPHLNYVDSDAYGFFTVTLTHDKCVAEFTSVEEPINPAGRDDPPIRRRVRFLTRAWGSGQEPTLIIEEVTGKPPLGGLKR